MKARRRHDVVGSDATRGELIAADMHLAALEAQADGALVGRLRYNDRNRGDCHATCSGDGGERSCGVVQRRPGLRNRCRGLCLYRWRGV